MYFAINGCATGVQIILIDYIPLTKPVKISGCFEFRTGSKQMKGLSELKVLLRVWGFSNVLVQWQKPLGLDKGIPLTEIGIPRYMLDVTLEPRSCVARASQAQAHPG